MIYKGVSMHLKVGEIYRLPPLPPTSQHSMNRRFDDFMIALPLNIAQLEACSLEFYGWLLVGWLAAGGPHD